jgi:hypothetical protein
MVSPPKLRLVPQLATADRRATLEQENTAELCAFKAVTGMTHDELAAHFGCSHDSIARYLDGQRPVPGFIVKALMRRAA